MRPGGENPFEPQPSPRWPRLRPSVVAVVFVGGCAGGLVRYAATTHWAAASYRFPWSTFAVNVAGSFVLALLVVVVSDVLGPSTYLRPLVGTGFCGALTTFSTVVVEADQMISHGRAATAAVYLVGTIAGGLAAGVTGIAMGRWFAARRLRSDRRGAM